MHTFRTVVFSLLILLLLIVGYSYLSGNAWARFPRAEGPAVVGTSGSVETARARGAEVGYGWMPRVTVRVPWALVVVRNT